DVPNLRTRLRWATGLGTPTPHVDPSGDGPRVYVFRQRAPLFGHNAPDPRLLKVTDTTLVSGGQWVGFHFDKATLDLAAAYPQIVRGSWFALVSNHGPINRSGLSGYVELCNATAVAFPSRRQFGLSGKVTRLTPDLLENEAQFSDLQKTLVLAQSE